MNTPLTIIPYFDDLRNKNKDFIKNNAIVVNIVKQINPYCSSFNLALANSSSSCALA